MQCLSILSTPILSILPLTKKQTLDVGSPDGSGLDLCRELRQARPTLPIVLLTARDGCLVINDDSFVPVEVEAEVMGFSGSKIFLMPVGSVAGIAPGAGWCHWQTPGVSWA